MRITIIFNPDAGDREPSEGEIRREVERAGYDAKLVPASVPSWRD